MRSVHLTNYYHKDSGGISTSYDHLLQVAEQEERRVCLIVPGEKAAITDRGKYGRIYYIPARRSPVFDRRYRLIMPWQYMIKPNLIREIMAKESPQMVEVGDKYALSIMGAMIRKNYFQKLGRPMLVHLSSERMDDNMRAFISSSEIARRLSRSFIRNYILPSFDFHVANSEYTARELFDSKNVRPTRFGKFCDRFFKSIDLRLSERVFVCTKGADIDGFSPDHRSAEARAAICRMSNIPETSKILLYSGRISPEKNIALLVDTMERLKENGKYDFRLLIAGNGPLARWLSDRNPATGNKIVLLGHVDKRALTDLYANADLYIHPNPREPFGISPLEAMASGTAVVLPNRGGVLSYATTENAWLSDPNQIAFANAVRTAMDKTPQRQKKITAALKTVGEHSSQSATKNLFTVYDHMWEKFCRQVLPAVQRSGRSLRLGWQ